MPFLPAPLSVTAKTTAMSAFLPEVMNCLTPFSTYSLPLRSARVVIAEASEPTCGSVSAKAPSMRPCARGLKNFSFCAALPYPDRMPATRLFTATMVAVAQSPAAISSQATASAV